MSIDWNDVQGIVVRGNNYPRSWHMFYSFPGESPGKDFLRWIHPQLDTALPFSSEQKPDSLLYAGLTYPGLRVLGLEKLLKKIDPTLALGEAAQTSNPFPPDFIDEIDSPPLGDTSPADHPSTWWNKQFATKQIHGSLHIYCQTEPTAQERLKDVRAKMKSLGIAELNPRGGDARPLEGMALPERRVHFDFVDGIAQPDVDWGNETPAPGKVDRRHFLLGYDGTIRSAPNFKRTGAFFRNGTYLAFRWMSQDVAAFDQFLTASAPLLQQAYPTATNLRELLAAKLVGRWRSGVALMDAPINEDPALLPGDSFLYEGPDPHGLHCPFSAHVRASNPRDQQLNPIVDEVPRLIRRGMPYGFPWKKGVNDDEERGLFGMFLCASLERQFQMIMRWMNVNDFSPRFGGVIPASQDPLFGGRGLAAQRPPFRIPTPTGVVAIPMPDKAFVRARGMVYLMLPGLKTLRTMFEAAS